MSAMPWQDSLILILYAATLGCLAVFGFHRLYMVLLYYRYRRRVHQAGVFDPARAPVVTVQLPLYNEYYVAERLIGAVAALDYPRHALEIQVLDDSADETQEVARQAVERYRQAGLDIHYIHRANREGFKAGALEAGLRQARGAFIAIFDADFVPPPDTLRRTIPHFADPAVGMVQMRWEHINRDSSLLTRLQAILLDGHFVIEHAARNRSERFFNFNGTAGIWRRETIEQAGGWQHDTLTEDLDLSYRAQLRGWRFVYLPDVTAPGEVPVDINGFKSQQHRWTKGAIQTGVKLLRRIWASPIPLKVKIEATMHLSNNLAYLLMLLLSFLMWPALQVRREYDLLHLFLWDTPFLAAATISVGVFYICSQIEIRRGFWRCLLLMPGLMAIGIGLSINNSKAVLEGLFGRSGEFVRTAKYRVEGQGARWQGMKYAARRNLWIPLFELAMGVYFTAIVVALWNAHLYVTMPFMMLFQMGYLYVGFLSLFQRPLSALLASRAESGLRVS